MVRSQINVDLTKVRKSILKWLQSRLDEKGYEWIESKNNHLKEGGGENWEFYTAFSAVPRHTGKEKLDLTGQEKQQADAIRTDWEPSGWTVDQLGRTLLVLSIAQSNQGEFLDILEKTFVSGDTGEAVALYQSLPVLPYPEKLQKQAAEGLRSNMTSVFNAVALQNPYPADYLDEGAWNQLVLKALFVGSPLYKIKGIDRRSNKKLAEMLVDYAHERWAADRSVSPELWRPVGPFAKRDVVIRDLQKVLDRPGEIQKQAAILALTESPAESAQAIVTEHESLLKEIEQQEITWDVIGRKYNE